MEWTQEQNLRKEEERIGEPEEQEENTREREKTKIGTIWNFFSLYTKLKKIEFNYKIGCNLSLQTYSIK